MKWLWIILALLYVVSRFDFIPDMIPIYGWIDDIAVLVFLFRYLNRQRRPQQSEDPGMRGGRTADGRGWEQYGWKEDPYRRHQGEKARANGHKSPYEILDVAPGADESQIRSAYRKLASQYHPDKVAHLGKEFQDIAEQRFKEIQEAYETLVRERKR